MGVVGGQEQKPEVLENPENKGEERGGPAGDREMGLNLSGALFNVYHFLSEWPCAGCFTSLNLSFPTCKMGTIPVKRLCRGEAGRMFVALLRGAKDQGWMEDLPPPSHSALPSAPQLRARR